MRVAQGMKDQASKCDSAIKSLKDSTRSPSSCCSSKQRRLFCSSSSSSRSAARGGSDEKLRQAEESLRTVMYLSCWGPN